MKYELNQLGSQKFEELVQALASAEYGFEGKIYGKGPDGQREFTMEQDGLSFGYIQTKGYIVGQAKYRDPDNQTEQPLPWLKRNLKEELEGFRKKKQAGDRIPDTWLFFTNITLTPVKKTGGRDVIEQYLTEGGYRDLIPNILILAADDILSLLNARPEIAKHYAQFLTSGDVLAELMLHLEAEQRKQEAFLSHLAKRMEQTRTDHPSFTLMRPNELDRRLFPRIPARGKVGDGKECPVWDIIVESWQEGRRPIVLEGDGGIGKTVALLRPEGEARMIPALYIPLFQMVNGDTVLSAADYLKRELDDDYYLRFLELSRRPWLSKPSILLLLDGVNELPAQQRWQVVKDWREWAAAHNGAQLVAVSRPLDKITLDLGKALGEDSIYLKLARISRETAKDYLKELRREIPTENAPIWEVLTLPLFLVLYAKTGTLDGLTACNYPLAPKPATNGGALIWNYLQRELLRQEDENWVLKCAVACEYLLPAVGYEMVKNHWFTITMEKLDEVLRKAQACLTGPLPRHLLELYQNYDIIHEGRPPFDEVKWRSLLIHEIGLLTRNQDDKNACSFVHQHFRDCFAGLYLVNAAEAEGGLPELWRHSQPPLAMEYAAQLMEDGTAGEMWKALRGLWPAERGLLYVQLELHRRRMDGLSRLDFSGMDLRGISLARYGEGLFRKSDLTNGTLVDEAVFQGVGHSGGVRCVTTLPDGRIVSGSDDKTLRVWDSYSGDCLRVIPAGGWVEHIRYDPSEGCIVFQLRDDSLWRCDPDGGVPEKWEGPAPAFEKNVTLPDGRMVKPGATTVQVYSPEGERVTTLAGHTSFVKCVGLLPDGRIVSGSVDHTLRIWSPEGGPALACLGRTDPFALCLASVGKNRWVSGHGDGTLRLWDSADGRCGRVLTGHTDWVRGVAALSDDCIVSGSHDHTLRVWNLTTGESKVLKGHTNWVNCVAVLPDGRIVSGAAVSPLRVWNQNTGESRPLEGHTSLVTCIAALPDGRIVSGSDDKTLRVWNQNTGESRPLKGHTGWVRCVAVLPDGRIVSGSWDRTLRVWNQNTGESRPLEGHTRSVTCVAALPDGRIVSGADDNTLRVWNLTTGKSRPLEGHTRSVTCVAVLPDGRIVSGSNDCTLRIWNADTGICLAVIPVSEQDLTGMNLSKAVMDEKTARLLYYNGAEVSPEDAEAVRKLLAGT